MLIYLLYTLYFIKYLLSKICIFTLQCTDIHHNNTGGRFIVSCMFIARSILMYRHLLNRLLHRLLLAHKWPSLPQHASPPVSLLSQVIRQIREDRHAVLLGGPLAEPTVVPRVDTAALSSPVVGPSPLAS